MYDHDDASPINPWHDKDAPQPALIKPAWFMPGLVIQTDVKMKMQRLATTHHRETARQLTPVTPSAQERAAGIFLEVHRSRGGRCQYRAIRLEGTGDDPLPSIPYRTNAVQR